MTINDINIGTKWEDTLGKLVFNNKDKVIKRNAYREVIITDKTKDSLQYKDSGGYLSWERFEDFIRIEKSNGKQRFIELK